MSDLEHPFDDEMPDGILTRSQTREASDAQLDDMMGICAVEPAEPDKCLACYAYMVAQERAERRKREPGKTAVVSPSCFTSQQVPVEAKRHPLKVGDRVMACGKPGVVREVGWYEPQERRGDGVPWALVKTDDQGDRRPNEPERRYKLPLADGAVIAMGEWEAATRDKHEFEDSMIGPGGLAGAKIPLALIDDSKAMERFLRGDSNYQTTSAWVNGRDAWKAAVLWCRSVGFEPPERIMPNEPLPESVLDAAHVAHNEWWPTAGNADADPTTGEAFQAGVEWLASKLTGSEQ